MVVPFVLLQGVDLNMLPPLDDSLAPRHTCSVVRPTATRDYQIALIESQGPSSRGVRLLRAGLAGIGKTYVPQLQSTKHACPIMSEEGVHSNLGSIVKDSSPPETLTTVHPVGTREHQMSLIESQGPNSRALRLLRAGLADRANTPKQEGLRTASL